jgi:hypothetical protein
MLRKSAPVSPQPVKGWHDASRTLDHVLLLAKKKWWIGFKNWNSSVNIPAQKLSVQLATNTAERPFVLLADPISRRKDFLISLSAEA